MLARLVAGAGQAPAVPSRAGDSGGATSSRARRAIATARAAASGRRPALPPPRPGRHRRRRLPGPPGLGRDGRLAEPGRPDRHGRPVLVLLLRPRDRRGSGLRQLHDRPADGVLPGRVPGDPGRALLVRRPHPVPGRLPARRPAAQRRRQHGDDRLRLRDRPAHVRTAGRPDRLRRPGRVPEPRVPGRQPAAGDDVRVLVPGCPLRARDPRLDCGTAEHEAAPAVRRAAGSLRPRPPVLDLVRPGRPRRRPRRRVRLAAGAAGRGDPARHRGADVRAVDDPQRDQPRRLRPDVDEHR